MSSANDLASLRRWVYLLMITVAAGAVAGRILNAELVFEPSIHRDADDPKDERPRVWPAKVPEKMPTFSSNDRSRWATVRALVDEGTYVIGRRDPSQKTAENKYGDVGFIFQEKSAWGTVDRVLKPDSQEFYSSKPPLLPTLVAGEYWFLKHALGLSIVEDRWAVVRVVLFTWNLLPFVIYLWLLSQLVERFGRTDWGKLYVMAAACFGTFLTTFLVTLNNHTVAACSALFALYPAALVLDLNSRSRLSAHWTLYATSGFFAAFTACNELPALAFAVGLFVVLLLHSPLKTQLFFLPAAALPAFGFFWTNYLAIGQWTPAYGEFGGPWYEFPGSHWVNPDQRGIDWAFTKESRAMYVFHFLFGHHGVFSLTPIWILSFIGMILGALAIYRVALARRGGDVPEGERREGETEGTRDGEAPSQPRLWGIDLQDLIAAGTLLVSVVVIGYFLARDRWNYGGWSCGPRWLFWLIPLWLLTLLPVADRLAERRWGRVLGYILLALSVLSVSFPAWNPWRMPWLYRFMEAQGWIQY